MNTNPVAQMAVDGLREYNHENLPFASPSVLEGGERFSSLLSGNEMAPVDAVDRILSVSTIGKSSASAMGEMLVAKLDAVGSEFKENMAKAHTEMNKAPDQLSLRDLLKLEYEFAVITLQVDVVSKGVQKAVQNVDTLVKIQ